MDIEGYEVSVLKASENTLNQDFKINIVCCTYHNQDDAELLSKFFKKISYDFEFSDGYIIFIYDNKLDYPYFRKGLIRAKKKSI